MSNKIVGIVSVIVGILLVLVFVMQASFLYTVTITFDTGLYGEPLESMIITAEESPVLPELTLEGFSFDGWFLEDSFETPASILVLTRESRKVYASFNPNEYIISFEARGGSIVEPIYADFGASINAPDEPSRAGYAFDGWYEDQALTNEFSFDTMPLGGETLYAKWTAVPFTISYEITDFGLNNELNPEDYTVEDRVISLLNPMREGYTFRGWYVDEETSESVSFIDTGLLSDITVYAKWEINTYTISFDFGKGDDAYAQGSITSPFGTDISDEFPFEETFEPLNGYTFEGWYFDESYTELYEDTTMPAFDGTLYAYFKPITYNISYVLDEGMNDELNPLMYTIETDTIVLEDASRVGYSFEGWFSDEAFSDEVIIINKGSTDDVTLYAKFDIITYDIKYELDASNNADSNPDSFVVTDSVITLDDPVKEGHTFNGWFSDAELTTQVTEIDPSTVVDTTVYAKWTINTYNVTYDINNEDVDPLVTTSEVLTFASTLTFEAPTLDGWELSHWEDQDGLLYNTGNLLPAKDAVFTAVWVEKVYYLNFYLYEEKYTNDERFDFDEYGYNKETITAPADPERNGYEFLGWVDPTNPEGDYFVFEGTWSDPDLEEFGVYADWQILVFTITYVLDEDETNDPNNPTEYNVEDNQLFNPPTKPGYTFDIWVNVDNNTEKEGVDGDYIALTLQPKWELATYTVTYKDGNQTLTDTGNLGSFDIETEPFNLSDYSKSGYNFLGWYDNPEFTGSSIGTITPLSTPNDFTLYAKWEAGKYFLTLDLGTGGGISGAIQYGFEEAISLTNPTRTGYSFLGWSDGTKTWNDGDLMPMEDLALTAQWQEGQYSISYTTNQTASDVVQPVNLSKGISSPITVNLSCDTSKTSYNYEDDAFSLPVCSKPGWTFDGWFTNEDFTGSPITQVTKNSTTDYDLYAKWTRKEYIVTFTALLPADHNTNPEYNNATINSNGEATWTKTYYYGAFIDRPAATRNGYDQTGFTMYSGMTGAAYTIGTTSNNLIGIEGSPTEAAGNYGVKLEWKLKIYSITFDPNYTDDDNVGKWTYTYDGLTVEDKIDFGFPPYRPGYTFLGWFDAATGGKEYTEDDFMIAFNLTLYARWAPIVA